MEDTGNIVIYESEGGDVRLDVRLENGNVWLTQQQMALLYGKAPSTINEHIGDIFDDKELLPEACRKKFGNSEFQQKAPYYYNLDMIIAVGFRVRSRNGVIFRQWAAERIQEYIVKGFTMDDERLKQLGGGGYWKELLNRIRDIRASEKVFYRQILDIYATSVDYDPKADMSIEFFKKVQNKIHYAIHGQTAAEIIYSRADAEKEFMGLTTFKGSRPHLSDAVIAKNYLNEKELRSLGQLVSGYLDFAERQAERKQAMSMADWAKHLDGILTSTGEKLLTGAGSISHEAAMAKAETEYKKYKNRILSNVEKDYLQSMKLLEDFAARQ